MNQSELSLRAHRALAQGDPAALALFDAALASDPGNAVLWLGKAKALALAGDRRGARIVTEQITAQAPGFVDALTYLAELRLGDGEPDFAAPFRSAAARTRDDPNIMAAHIEALASCDRWLDAAEIAAEARRRFPQEPHFTLLEAIHASASGQWDRAEAIFATLADPSAQRLRQEARHRLRASDARGGERLLARVLEADPGDIVAWALMGIAWRLADDPRAAWLHEQAGLVNVRPLAGRDGLIQEAAELIRDLHARSGFALGQSLRGGTQTRGILFNRTEPVLAELHQAIRTTLEDYRAGLAPFDASHPLLRYRNRHWRLAGSWSVRLAGGGDHHTAHIHPQGVISSALYLIVPSSNDLHGARSGWLELGRPPADLRLSLAPIRVVAPVEGQLALFPSTLYHGTSPFGSVPGRASERVTVAFDVIGAASGQPSAPGDDVRP